MQHTDLQINSSVKKESFLILSIIKLTNSASPFKFRQAKFSQQSGLENDKMYFSQTV